MSQKKKKVAAYCRVSTLEQKKKGYGIDIQIRDATLYAEHHGLLVEKFYKDEGESGVKEDRRALKQLLRNCKAGRVGVIILPYLDRLSREVRIAENLFHEFKQLGVRILIADMPGYNGDRKDVLIRQILEAIAEENRREIIERLLKGRQERVRRGMFPGGTVPYGYMRRSKAIIINTHEAEVVREIFALESQGHTGQRMADALNSLGFVRRNGKPWTQRQVCRVLQNERLYREGLLHYGEACGKNEVLTILNSAS